MKKILSLLLLFCTMAVNAGTLSEPYPGKVGQDSFTPSDKDTLVSIAERVLNKKFTSRFNVDFCTSMNGSLTDGVFDEAYLKLNRVRFNMRGKFTDRFSYRIRYSFNKSYSKNSLDNVPPALEYANIQWHPDDRFKLTIGKQFLNCAGYEALGNSLYIREFASFNNSLSFYRIAVTAAIKPDKERNHEIAFQITNNREKADSDIYRYGLPEGCESARFPFLYSVRWNGWMADRAVNLHYGAAAGPLAKGKNVYYLTCGNVYEKGPIMTYLDVMFSREEIDLQQRVTSLQGDGLSGVTAANTQYLSFIAKFDYRFHPKWNAYVKGAYETASVYKSNGTFEKGRYITEWNAQASVEWLPFTNDKGFKVFLHYIYRGMQLGSRARSLNATVHDVQRISAGVIYELPIF